MNRRQLLKGGCALLAASAVRPSLASDDVTAYTPQAYQEALASGKPFMLDFYAPW